MPALLLQATVSLALVASGTNVRLQAVSAPYDGVIWASGVEGTFVRSVDGGRTWTAGVVLGHEERQFRDIHAVDRNTAYLLSSGSGDASRIFKTEDGGAHWEQQFANDIPDAFFDCMDFWDERNGLAYSDSVNGEIVMVRTTNGETWERIDPGLLPAALPGEGGFAASGTCVTVTADARAFVAMGVGAARILRTNDRGASWEVHETPVPHEGDMSGLTSVSFLESGAGVAAGGDIGNADAYDDNVAVSEDFGESWWKVGGPTFPGPVYGIAFVPHAPELSLMAVGPGGASYSLDNGSTWTNLSDDTYWSLAFTPSGVGFLVGPDGRIARVELQF